MSEGDEWKTAFRTPTGHFEYLVLSIFSLSNTPGPAVFQALINNKLKDMINKFVFVYLDDISIFPHLFQVHIQHVRRVLQQLLENQSFVKVEKCTFNAQLVPYLRSIISVEGIGPCNGKSCL